jgi:hypothetical protein
MHARSIRTTLAGGVAALVLIVTLTACSTSEDPTVTAAPRAGAPTDTAETGGPTATVTPSPAVTSAATAAAAATPTATSADAAHWFEVCSDGAAASGVSELRSVNDPVPVTDGGRFTLTYPVARFSDGHTDPYAIFICALSDGSSTARFVQGGLSDSH